MNTPHYDPELNAILEDMHSALYKYRAGEVARRCQLAVELIQCAKLTQEDWMKGTSVYRGPGGQFTSPKTQQSAQKASDIESELAEVKKLEKEISGLKDEVKNAPLTKEGKEAKNQEINKKEDRLGQLKPKGELERAKTSADVTTEKSRLEAMRSANLKKAPPKEIGEMSKAYAQTEVKLKALQAKQGGQALMGALSGAWESAGNAAKDAMDWGSSTLEAAGEEIDFFTKDPKGWTTKHANEIGGALGDVGSSISSTASDVKASAQENFEKFKADVEGWKEGKGTIGQLFNDARLNAAAAKNSPAGKAVGDAWNAVAQKVAEAENSIGKGANHVRQVMTDSMNNAQDTLSAISEEGEANGDVYKEMAGLAGSILLNAPLADNQEARTLLAEEAGAALSNIKERVKAKQAKRPLEKEEAIAQKDGATPEFMALIEKDFATVEGIMNDAIGQNISDLKKAGDTLSHNKQLADASKENQEVTAEINRLKGQLESPVFKTMDKNDPAYKQAVAKLSSLTSKQKSTQAKVDKLKPPKAKIDNLEVGLV